MDAKKIAVAAAMTIALIGGAVVLNNQNGSDSITDANEWGDADRRIVDGIVCYLRYDGLWKPVAEMNIKTGDWTYLKTETKDSVTLQIGKDVITIPTANTVFNYTETRISPTVTYTNADLAASRTDINASHAYIVFPYSLSGKATTTETHIQFGKFTFETGEDHISVMDSKKSDLSKDKHSFKIVGDEIRLYYDKAAMAKTSSDVSFKMHSWSVNNDIISGLTDVGGQSSPTVFQKDSTWYLISGEGDGVFNGWHWTGSTWTTNSTIISGLTDVGGYSAPTVFQKDSTWYLIAGEQIGVWNGWHWTGSTWTTNSTIISGLADVGDYSAPTVFQKDGTWYLISGEHTGVWNGWHWTGSTWTTNSTIISGLTDVGAISNPTVFQKDGTWYLISGDHSGVWNGWHWTGSTWTTNSTIISGLTDVGYYSAPTVFQKDSTWYLISGEHTGVWYGWNLPALTAYTPPDPTTLQNTTTPGWVNYTWSTGSGNVTDSYNVLHNDVWSNGSANAYLNSEVGGGNWSNITVYAWNSSSTGTLSVGSVSDQVTAPHPAPSITGYAPSTPVSKTVGESQTFNVTVDQLTDCKWYINTSLKQTNGTPSLTHAYTNTSIAEGYWNFSAVVNNTNGTDMQTWWVTVSTSGTFSQSVYKDSWQYVTNLNSTSRTLSQFFSQMSGYYLVHYNKTAQSTYGYKSGRWTKYAAYEIPHGDVAMLRYTANASITRDNASTTFSGTLKTGLNQIGHSYNGTRNLTWYNTTIASSNVSTITFSYPINGTTKMYTYGSSANGTVDVAQGVGIEINVTADTAYSGI